jgi:DNA repair protein SbcD/Mre11
MRILHTSDWHLGRTLHGVDLLDHQADVLDHLVALTREAAVDVVLLAGDVYDRAVPPVPAVELLGETLHRLSEHALVVVTPGNHDSAARLGFGARLFTDRVRVRCRTADIGTPVVVANADGDAAGLVYPLPYLEPEVARHELTRLGAAGQGRAEAPVGRSHEAVLSAAMQRVTGDLTSRRAEGVGVPAVVMAHAFVVGGEASESERDIRVGGVESAPAGVLTGGGAIDYVALGHLHGPQEIRAGTAATSLVRYAGSPLAYSFSERTHRKSTAVVEVGAAGGATVELVPTPVPRPLADVTGSLDDVLGRAFDDVADAWVRVVVTDAVRPPELYGTVRRRFSHALVIQHRPEDAPATGASPVVDSAHDPLGIAAQFVAEVGGRAATTDELRVLRTAYEAALGPTASGR